jgi:hypothetical protein
MERGTGDRGVAGSRGLDGGSLVAAASGAWLGSWIPGLGPSLLAPVTRNAGAFGGGLVGGAFGGMIPDGIADGFSQAGGTAYLSSGAFLLHHPLVFLDGCWDGVWQELQGWWELAWSLLSLDEWTKLIGRLGEAAQVLFGDAQTAFFCGWSVGEGMTGSVTEVLKGDGETIAYQAGLLLGPILLELAGSLAFGLGMAKMGLRTGAGVGARVVDGLVAAVRRGRVPPVEARRIRSALAGNTATIDMPPSPRDRPRIELPESPGPLDDDLPTSPVPGVASARVPPDPGPGGSIPGVASARATESRALGPAPGKPPRDVRPETVRPLHRVLDEEPPLEPGQVSEGIHAPGGTAKPAISLHNRQALKRYLGIHSLADDPELLEMWVKSVEEAATSRNLTAIRKGGREYRAQNDFQRLLQRIARSEGDFTHIDNSEIAKAWAVVRRRFNEKYKRRFGAKDYDDLHHDKLKSIFPESAFDPRNLYPMVKDEHSWIHDILSGGMKDFSRMEDMYRTDPGDVRGGYRVNREVVEISDDGELIRTDAGQVFRRVD